ncbi:MAG: SseB family protein [Ardenticatenaceae bacterium]
MAFNEFWQAEQQRRAVAEAITVLKPDDASTQARFFQALQNASLLLPVEALPEGMQNGDLLAGQNVPVQVKMIKGQENEVYLPLFTGEASLRRGQLAEQPFIAVAFPAIVQMALQARLTGIVIDQGSPAMATVPLSALLNLSKSKAAEGAQPQPAAAPAPTPAHQSQLRVGPPPRVLDYPEIAELNDWLQKQRGLVQAYLFGLMRGNSPPVLAVGMGFPDAPPAARMQEMARELPAFLGPSSLLLLDGQLATLLARQPGAIRFDLRKRGARGS